MMICKPVDRVRWTDSRRRGLAAIAQIFIWPNVVAHVAPSTTEAKDYLRWVDEKIDCSGRRKALGWSIDPRLAQSLEGLPSDFRSEICIGENHRWTSEEERRERTVDSTVEFEQNDVLFAFGS